jgi:hypothetical protein
MNKGESNKKKWTENCFLLLFCFLCKSKHIAMLAMKPAIPTKEVDNEDDEFILSLCLTIAETRWKGGRGLACVALLVSYAIKSRRVRARWSA